MPRPLRAPRRPRPRARASGRRLRGFAQGPTRISAIPIADRASDAKQRHAYAYANERANAPNQRATAYAVRGLRPTAATPNGQNGSVLKFGLGDVR